MDLTEARGVVSRRHPWEVARARFFLKLLREAGVMSAPRAAIDVGAGDGYLGRTVLADLPAGSRMICYDLHYSDADLATFGATADAGLTFTRQRPPGRFDLILLLDVLEHVPDDRAFLEEIVADALAPGGTVMVSVPAWQRLFSAHDEALKHYRRYSPDGLRAMLSEVGLVVRRSGGAFHSLLLSRAFGVARERVRRWLGRAPTPPRNLGDWKAGAATSAVIEGALFLDNALSLLVSRFGTGLAGLTIWAVASGPADRT